jgi:hypothetical protein
MDRAQGLFWKIANACALLLLFAPMTGRTSRTILPASEMRAAGGGMTHSAGWDWVAIIAGGVALSALLIGCWLRPGVVRPSVCAALAAVCFAVAAAAALGHWFDLMAGNLDIGGADTHPAPAVAYFAAIATAGAVASLTILAAWFRPGSVKP